MSSKRVATTDTDDTSGKNSRSWGSGRPRDAFDVKNAKASKMMNDMQVKITTHLEVQSKDLDREDVEHNVSKLILPFIKDADNFLVASIYEEITTNNSKREQIIEVGHVSVSREMKALQLSEIEKSFIQSYGLFDRKQLKRTSKVISIMKKDVELLLITSERANPEYLVNSILIKSIRINEERRSAPYNKRPTGDTQEDDNRDVGNGIV